MEWVFDLHGNVMRATHYDDARLLLCISQDTLTRPPKLTGVISTNLPCVASYSNGQWPVACARCGFTMSLRDAIDNTMLMTCSNIAIARASFSINQTKGDHGHVTAPRSRVPVPQGTNFGNLSHLHMHHEVRAISICS